jgi:hypothetical protein
MIETDGGDADYTDGKLYSAARALSYVNDGVYNYRFYASDGIDDASGTPTSNSSVTVMSTANNPPSLEWATGNCLRNGARPGTGADGTEFQFYINYIDPDNECPPAASDIQVWIDENDNSTYEEGEKNNLTEVDSGDTTCTDGKLYKVEKMLSLTGDINYRFYAFDGTDTAFGEPVSSGSSVTIVSAATVRPSGSSQSYDYTSVISAINAVSGTILVYPNDDFSAATYSENITMYNKDNRTVKSACGADYTIVSSASTGHAVTVQDSSNFEMDGFSVTGATNAGALASAFFINRVDSTTTIIKNSKVYGNYFGFYINEADDVPVEIENVEIYNNSGRGIYSVNADDDANITNCEIHSHDVSITGAAIRSNGGAEITISKSVIRDNISSADGGAISINGGVFTITNSILVDNQGSNGGVINTANMGTLTVINSTFADNTATGNGGVLYLCQPGNHTFRNSIFWNNSAAGSGDIAYKACSGFYSDFMTITDSNVSTSGDNFGNGTPTVSNNITPAEDPLFVDAAADNYHIQSGSPVQDQASGTYAPADDIDGDSRPLDGGYEMGADEIESGGANSAPGLAWTGETDYTSDGIDPDSGVGGTIFTFRVDYTDADNNKPVLMQIWIDEDNNGAYNADEKFTMSEVDSGDTVYTDGKRYTLSRVLSYIGSSSLDFRFYATDGIEEASGDPTSEQSVSLTNNIPVLSWTGEPDYIDDGVNPGSGEGGTEFTFRVKYTDGDNVAPDLIQVWVDTDNSGVYDAHEKYTMTLNDDDGDSLYTNGEKYTKTLSIPYIGDGAITYRFYASDGEDAATGGPVSDTALIITPAPLINNVPNLSWADINCISNGVRPGEGADGADFQFNVIYTDPDPGQCATDILVLVDKDDNGTYESEEKYILAGDGGDLDCTDGRLYETTVNLVVAGDLKYSFFATDSFEAATGIPVSDSTVTVLDALKVRPTGGEGWYSTIQSAEDNSTDPSTILVYPNGDFTAATYTENIEARTVNLTMRSTCGSDLTIIDGGGSGIGVLLRADNQVLDGFSVTNATDGLYINPAPYDITVKNNKIYGNTGFGINVNNGFDIHIYNNEIYNNNNSGIRANDGSTLDIKDCDIHHNYAGWGGGIYFNGAIHTITDSVIRDNIGSDGGAITFNSVGEGTTVTNTTISNNEASGRGGGMYITSGGSGSKVTFDKCTITGNQATSGGGMYVQNASTPFVKNTIFAENQAVGGGGAVYVHSGKPEFVNDTFVDNKVTAGYGGVFRACVIGEQFEVRNSIFWGNTASVNGHIGSRYGCNGNGPLLIITDSDISESPDAKSNFYHGVVTLSDNLDPAQDPLFDVNGNYHLQSGSPVIDHASDTYAPGDDFDGQSRPLDIVGKGNEFPSPDTHDMGADEYYAPADSTTAGYATAYPSDSSNTSITVTMPYLGDANGDNACTVDYKLTSAHTSVWTNKVTDADCGTSPYTIDITGLTADEKYDVRLTYNDQDGVFGRAQRSMSSVDLGWYVDLTKPSRSVAEDVGTVTVTATLSRISNLPVTVPFTVSGTATAGGTDYNLADGNIIITAGNLTGTADFTVNDDSLDEGNETVIVTMGPPVNATADRYDVHTITITDNDDPPSVEFTLDSQAKEGEGGMATITAQLSAVSGKDVTVPFTVNVASTAVDPGDYSITASPLTITAGSTTADITIAVADDSLKEDDETVIVDMGTPTNATQGATTTHTVTIEDDPLDTTTGVTFTSVAQFTAAESGTAVITAQLSAASGLDVTVPFTINVASTAVEQETPPQI